MSPISSPVERAAHEQERQAHSNKIHHFYHDNIRFNLHRVSAMDAQGIRQDHEGVLMRRLR
jgi:hypothetical protein